MSNQSDSEILETLVEVFQTEVSQEASLIKSKLETASITAEVENSYLGFLTTPTSTTLRVKFPLKNEAEALSIIDEYLQTNNV